MQLPRLNLGVFVSPSALSALLLAVPGNASVGGTARTAMSTHISLLNLNLRVVADDLGDHGTY